MSDLIADDLFLDRLAGRVDAGSDPLAGLLGALATQADTPLPSRTSRRRVANKHRYFGAFAALAVAASGAGVAAAVTLPSNGPSQADRARIVKMMDDSARSSAPSALLSRLGLPQTIGSVQAAGLVLARRDDGTIVLLPAAMVSAGRPKPGAGQTEASGATGAGNGQGGNAQNGKAANGNGQGGNGQGGTGGTEGSGGTTAGQGDQGGQGGQGNQGGSTQTGTPAAANNGKKPTPGTKGGKNATPTPTPTGTTSTEAVAPRTALAPATTPTSVPTSRARVTGSSPTTPPRSRPTPKPTASTTSTSSTVGGATAGVAGAMDAVGGVVDTAVPAVATAIVPASTGSGSTPS